MTPFFEGIRGWFITQWDKLVAATESFHGRKLGILIASSLVATSLIVTAAFTATTGKSPLSGPLAGILGQSFAADGGSSDDGTADTADTGTSDTGDTGPSSLPPPAADQTVQTPSSSNTGTDTSSTDPTSTDDTSTDDTGTTGTTGPTGDDGDNTNTDPEPTVGRVKHVFIINLNSPGYDQTWGTESQMPYLSGELRPKGELLSKFSILDDDPMVNGIAAIGGQKPNKLTTAGCPAYKEFPAKTLPDKKGFVPGNGCIYPYNSALFDQPSTVADQFTAKSLVWHAYVQDMVGKFGAGNCIKPDIDQVWDAPKGGYAVQRNPFIYFRSLLDLGDCGTNDVPYTDLAKDLKKEKSTPSYSYIVPNLCNVGVVGQCADGAAEGPAAADAFLKSEVPKIMKSAAYKKDGLLIVTFASASPPAGTANPDQVGTLLLSPFVSTNTASAAKLDTYSLLRTVEDLFGFDHIAQAAASSTKSFAAPLLGNVGGD